VNYNRDAKFCLPITFSYRDWISRRSGLGCWDWQDSIQYRKFMLHRLNESEWDNEADIPLGDWACFVLCWLTICYIIVVFIQCYGRVLVWIYVPEVTLVVLYQTFVSSGSWSIWLMALLCTVYLFCVIVDESLHGVGFGQLVLLYCQWNSGMTAGSYAEIRMQNRYALHSCDTDLLGY